MAFVGSAAAQGPISPYFLTAGDQVMNHRLTGMSLLSWGAANAGEYPIAVYGGSINRVRTSGPITGNGAEYDFNGNVTGGPFSLSGVGSCWDSTTDGNFNYLMDYSNGNVLRASLTYGAVTTLFGGFNFGDFLGITYDRNNNSLWISGWGSNVVRDYTLGGSLLSSFSATAAPGSLTSLALDPADNTLWMGTQNTLGTFFQYSKAGALLQTVVIPGLAGQNTLGGEFPFAASAVPEPMTIALAGLGLAGAAGAGWRRVKRRRKTLRGSKA
jgi:hypothetical protein